MLSIPLRCEFLIPSSAEVERVTIEEWECLMRFKEWFLLTKLKLLRMNFLRDPDHRYAGTIDRLCEIKGEPYVFDFETGQYIWTEYELRLSAYNDVNLYLPDGLNLTSTAQLWQFSRLIPKE
jgi:hypothetical protein